MFTIHLFTFVYKPSLYICLQTASLHLFTNQHFTSVYTPPLYICLQTTSLHLFTNHFFRFCLKTSAYVYATSEKLWLDRHSNLLLTVQTLPLSYRAIRSSHQQLYTLSLRWLQLRTSSLCLYTNTD